MPSSVQAYQISIVNSFSGSGFIDNLTVAQYGANFETAPPINYAASQAKRCANLRYREIMLQLGMVTNCYVPPPTIVSNATIASEASLFAFQIYVEHGAASLVTADELNPGMQFNGAFPPGDLACIARCIARALTLNLPMVAEVYNPTAFATTGPWGATAVPRFGDVVGSIDVAPYARSLALAEGCITVNAI